jgi:hypothetical protein
VPERVERAIADFIGDDSGGRHAALTHEGDAVQRHRSRGRAVGAGMLDGFVEKHDAVDQGQGRDLARLQRRVRLSQPRLCPLSLNAVMSPVIPTPCRHARMSASANRGAVRISWMSIPRAWSRRAQGPNRDRAGDSGAPRAPETRFAVAVPARRLLDAR